MQVAEANTTIIYFTDIDNKKNISTVDTSGWNVRIVKRALSHDEYVALLTEIESEKLILADGNRLSLEAVCTFVRQNGQQFDMHKIGYGVSAKPKFWLGMIQNLWHVDMGIVTSPILVGSKTDFLKAYGGSDLVDSTVAAVGYSLQKIGGLKFHFFQMKDSYKHEHNYSVWRLWKNYAVALPARYLFSGSCFSRLFSPDDKVRRDMVWRFLFLLFACFAFVVMPYISKDFGVTGDEFVDHRHAGYVLDYFEKDDPAALLQPQTALHLYGNSVQVITAAICRWFDVDHYYELRHFVGGLVGALGVLVAGWMGLRWGGGLCGLLCLLFMFFTPRFLGHSMNNLKDIPFAVGYMLSIFYTVRLFDYYPYFRLRHVLGLVLGIALALGTRSGGLILYPMLCMYAGLFYILHYGWKNSCQIGKYSKEIGKILKMILIVVVCSYVLSILLWPFALKQPLNGVVYSLLKFTNYGIGLRTTFDGEQMMSNMLPWRYAPQYLCIGMPIVILIGFFLYGIYAAMRKKEFSLISFFLFFATVFPVFWVIYCHSNLYGGIRHLLFVMPPMVVLAGRFWSEMIIRSRRYLSLIVGGVMLGLLSLPIVHTLRNHPNEYVYFNEFVGGLKKTYGDYETDYYFNSLKASADWFREHILPTLPKDKKTLVATQAAEMLIYYFRHDPNIKVVYSRYYEKHSKDWDYAIWGNVYVNADQLKNQLFPPAGALYAPTVDGFPMSCVVKRDTKMELEGFRLEKEEKYDEAIQVFQRYLADHPNNEEVYSKLGKCYFLHEDYVKAKEALEQTLCLQSDLTEALYFLTMTYNKLNEYPLALQTVDRMLADNAFVAEYWYLKAVIYYEMQQYQNSITTLNHLLKLDPRNEKAHVLAGNIFRDNEDYQQAAKMYERAVQFNRNAYIALHWADMLVRMKAYGPAEEILKQVEGIDGILASLSKIRCRMYLQEKQLKEAEELLNQWEKVQDDAEWFVLRAMYAHLKQEIEQREKMLELALKLDSNNMEALRMKTRLK